MHIAGNANFPANFSGTTEKLGKFPAKCDAVQRFAALGVILDDVASFFLARDMEDICFHVRANGKVVMDAQPREKYG